MLAVSWLLKVLLKEGISTTETEKAANEYKNSFVNECISECTIA